MKTTIAISVLALCVLQPLHAQTPSSTNPQNAEVRLDTFFEFASGTQTIEDRVADATAANRGIKPQVIELCGSASRHLDPPCKLGIGEIALPEIHAPFPSYGSPPTSFPRLAWLAGNSDIVVMGVPMDVRSFPLANRTFLFSEYSLRVDRKFSASPEITEGQKITIAVPGGSIDVDGITVKATDLDLEPLLLQQTYVFLLRKIRGTNAYRAMGNRTFLIKDSSVLPASKAETKAHPIEESRDQFLVNVQSAAVYVHPTTSK